MIQDAGVFKVQTNHHLEWNRTKYMKIFNINKFKVQQKMAGYLAHRVTSVQGAKRIFKLEVDGIASFDCVAGLVDGRTGPFEMGELKYELNHCL